MVDSTQIRKFDKYVIFMVNFAKISHSEKWVKIWSSRNFKCFLCVNINICMRNYLFKPEITFVDHKCSKTEKIIQKTPFSEKIHNFPSKL